MFQIFAFSFTFSYEPYRMLYTVKNNKFFNINVSLLLNSLHVLSLPKVALGSARSLCTLSVLEITMRLYICMEAWLPVRRVGCRRGISSISCRKITGATTFVIVTATNCPLSRPLSRRAQKPRAPCVHRALFRFGLHNIVPTPINIAP